MEIVVVITKVKHLVVSTHSSIHQYQKTLYVLLVLYTSTQFSPWQKLDVSNPALKAPP